MEITEKIKELISKVLNENRIELVEMLYRRESGDIVLRLLVDSPGGITLDECTRLNELIGNVLDKEDIMPESYVLEVCSPGLDRPLKTKRDFQRAVGRIVNVHTYEPVEDKRDHHGRIISVDDASVVVGKVRIPLNKIAKANLELIV